MIHPVILCGGSGTRLWPLSRKAYPKQFARIVGPSSSFAACARMVSGPGFAAPTVVTAAAFRFVVAEHLLELGVDPGAVLVEPAPRNTAPAILAAALTVARTDPEAVMLIAPSDHAIADPHAFVELVHRARPAAAAGRIVTFGITPSCAETGYGWLEPGDALEDGLSALRRFVEKPDRAEAERMFEAGGYFWNAGIFLFRADRILSAFADHAPDLVGPVGRAVEAARPDLGFVRLDPAAWDAVPAASIDYAVMEKARDLCVAPYSAHWVDLGGWNAVYREMERDAAGVAAGRGATAIDCRDTLLRSEVAGLEVVGIGLDQLVVVAMDDAVLVAHRDRGADVRLAVERLRAKGAYQAESFRHDHRPWGHFETLAEGDRFRVKRIVVHPGASLSLQRHIHRAEHWTVVSGTARVTIEAETRLLTENESLYVPLGATHRLENPGKVPMILIEVQTGAYVGEDDIERLEDIYARDPTD